MELYRCKGVKLWFVTGVGDIPLSIELRAPGPFLPPCDQGSVGEMPMDHKVKERTSERDKSATTSLAFVDHSGEGTRLRWTVEQ